MPLERTYQFKKSWKPLPHGTGTTETNQEQKMLQTAQKASSMHSPSGHTYWDYLM